MKLEIKKISGIDFFNVYKLAIEVEETTEEDFIKFKDNCYYGENYLFYKSGFLTFAIYEDFNITYDNSSNYLVIKNLGKIFEILIKYEC